MTAFPSVSLSFVSVICNDIVAQSAFYAGVFALPTAAELSSDHFRALRLGDTILGFHTTAAISLLDLPQDTPIGDAAAAFWTFEVHDKQDVDTLTDSAVAAGGRLVKAPYTTYYGAYQSVLRDPEGNVFRINKSGVA